MALLTSQVEGVATASAVRAKEPVVVLRFGDYWSSAQFTPDEARRLAAELVAAADELDPAAVSS